MHLVRKASRVLWAQAARRALLVLWVRPAPWVQLVPLAPPDLLALAELILLFLAPRVLPALLARAVQTVPALPSLAR